MIETPRDRDTTNDATDERADDDEKKKADVDEEAEESFPSSDAPSW